MRCARYARRHFWSRLLVSAPKKISAAMQRSFETALPREPHQKGHHLPRLMTPVRRLMVLAHGAPKAQGARRSTYLLLKRQPHSTASTVDRGPGSGGGYCLESHQCLRQLAASDSRT